MIDGILSNNEFSVSSNDTEQGAWYFALSIRGYFPLETSALLFKAKVLPCDAVTYITPLWITGVVFWASRVPKEKIHFRKYWLFK